MKIALVTPYSHGKGGVESVNHNLIDALSSQGHDMDVITSDRPFVGWKEKILGRIFGAPVKTANHLKNKATDYDLIICNGEFGFGIDHPRCIVLFHGCYFGFRKFLSAKLSWLQYANLTRLAWIQKLATKGKTVVAVSGFVKELLEEQGVKVHLIIPNCIDTERFSPRRTPAIHGPYLFVGTYNHYGKGFDVLEKLAETGMEIHCLTDKHPGHNLRHLGMVDQSNMQEIYSRYRMLLFPSRFEGMQMSPLEAMASGLPVVMSNVGLGPELKAEIPEFVVDGWDEEAVKEYRRRAIEIGKSYTYFSERARRFVEDRHSLSLFRQNWRRLVDAVGNA